MSEFEDRLNSILSSPEQMSKIMNLAKCLNPDEKKTGTETNDHQEFEASFPEGLDPKLFGLLSKAMKEYNNTDVSKQELIRSLRPFLSKDKKAKLDRAFRLTRIAHAAKYVLAAMQSGEMNV